MRDENFLISYGCYSREMFDHLLSGTPRFYLLASPTRSLAVFH